MNRTAPRGRLAIAPPAPEAPSPSEATQVVPARRDRSDASGEFSRVASSEERQTLPELEGVPVEVIDLDDLANERNKDTIPAPTWLGDDGDD